MEFVNHLYNDDIYINIIPKDQYSENLLAYRDNVLSNREMRTLICNIMYLKTLILPQQKNTSNIEPFQN